MVMSGQKVQRGVMEVLSRIVAVGGSSNIVMSEDEMAAWKSYFDSVAKLENYLMDLYLSKQERKNRAKREREREKVASLASLLMDPIQLNDGRPSQLYHWYRRSEPISTPVAIAEESKSKMTLQLRVADNWVDWVYLDSSEIENGKEGLFAARDFRKNFIVGFYTGAVVWQAGVEGGDKPSDEELATSSIQLNDYCLPVRDRNCRMVMVDPTSDQVGNDPALLRMGMHCVRETNDESKGNVKFIEDGSLQCVTAISCNTELLLFSGGDQNEKPAASIVDSKKPAAEIADSESGTETEVTADVETPKVISKIPKRSKQQRSNSQQRSEKKFTIPKKQRKLTKSSL